MNNFPALKQQLTTPAIRKNIESRIGENTGTFITSLLDLCGEDQNLAACPPDLVIKEAMKAAALQLPVNKSLGFAYVIAYKKKGVPMPNFQLGYKGCIQLALRTGQYKHLNAGIVYEGEEMVVDRIKGILTIEGEAISDKAIGYFAYMKLVNGFEKAIGWTKEKVEKHAKKFSKSFDHYSSPWKSDFDAMAIKTMLLQLVPKYGPMTIEMATAMDSDHKSNMEFNNSFDPRSEVENNANSEVIDIPKVESQPEPQNNEMSDEEKQQIREEEVKQAQAEQENNKKQGPDF